MNADFRALVIGQGGTWVAALPLTRVKVRRVISAGGLCGSTWIPGGSFLLDPSADVESALDVLAVAVRETPWQLLWLANVAHNAPRWTAFQDAIARAGMPLDVAAEYEIGTITIDRDWEACKMCWSRSHRQRMAKAARRLAQKGQLALRVYNRVNQEEVTTFLRNGLGIEDRSWKGEAGSSVVRRGEFAYVLRQSLELNRCGYLDLTFLELNDRPIAFAYGFNGKGVYHPCKIAYDPEYADFSPGALLFLKKLEQLHQDPNCRGIDFFGRLTEATSRWRPVPQPIGRLIVAPRRMLGRALLWAYGMRSGRDR